MIFSCTVRPRCLAPVGLIAVLSLAACGCSDGDGSGVIAAAPNVPPTAEQLPPPASGEDAYRYLLDYTNLAPYRTGTEGDKRMSAWFAGELRELGYAVEVESFPFERFLPRAVSLEIGDFRPAVFPLYYSGSTGVEGIRAPIVDIGAATPPEAAAPADAIAFAEVPLLLNFFAPTVDTQIKNAAAAGAKAMVIAFQGPLNEIVAKNVDARTGLCAFPVLLVGKEDGDRIQQMSGSEALFVLDGDIDPSASYNNIVATLPGTGEGLIVIGTPINPWFTSAAERGSGVGGLLTLARHFVEQGSFTKTLMFVGTGAHEVGFLGLQSFLDVRPDLASRIDAYVHLGASIAAKHFVEVSGEAVETGLPNPTVLFISENLVLQPVVTAAMFTAGMTNAATVPPTALNPGEQSTMYRAGVPIASISSSHFYFHTQRDLPDVTSAELLDPVVRGYRGLIEQLLQLDGETIRTANFLADQNAAPPPPAPECAVPAK